MLYKIKAQYARMYAVSVSWNRAYSPPEDLGWQTADLLSPVTP